MKTMLSLAMVALLCLSGVSLAANPFAPTISKTKFDTLTTVTGHTGFANLSGGTIQWHLRGWFDAKKNSVASIQLYLDMSYHAKGWRYYESASTVGGNIIPATVIRRKVEGCQVGGKCVFNEVVGIPLSVADLKAAAKNGLQLRLNAKSGDPVVVTIPSFQARPYLDAISRLKNQAADGK